MGLLNLKIKREFKFEDLMERARDAVLDMAEKELPGKEKMEKAIDELIRWLDDRIKWGGLVGMVVDSFDHIIMKLILMKLVQHVYEELLDEGEIPEPD